MSADFISLRDLWSGFNPDGVSRGVFVVFRGYMDESYDGQHKLLCLSCLVGEGAEWIRLARDWRGCLDAVNSRLAYDGRNQIERYHASDCNQRAGDFAGWSDEESKSFVMSLFDALRVRHLHAVSISIDWKAYRGLYPVSSRELEKELAAVYCLLLISFLHQIAKSVSEIHPSKRIALFHDRTNFDGAIAHMFSALRDNPEYECGPKFATLASMRWQDCIALQPADMFAFEAMRESLRRLQSPNRKSRRAFDAMRELRGVPWKHVSVSEAGLLKIEPKVRAEIKAALDDC